MKRIKKNEAQEILDNFTDDIKSVILGTVDEKSTPFSSYSPYVEDKEGNYYVCVSAIVPHAHNMYITKKAHIMFLEDESKAAHIYARRRLYFDADVEKFDENDEREENIGNLFIEKFGDTASFLLDMPDFRIYKLIPKNGNIVLGFGSAFSVDENRKITKLNDGVDKGGTKKGHPHGHAHEKNI